MMMEIVIGNIKDLLKHCISGGDKETEQDPVGSWAWKSPQASCLQDGGFKPPGRSLSSKGQVNTVEKAREFQKNIYFCFIDYAKAFDCVDHNKLWEILKEMGIPDHLICLLRNLYAGQEATVRTGHGTTDCSKQEKEYVKAVYCHPAYLTYMQSTS